jgi:hypothetical protein
MRITISGENLAGGVRMLDPPVVLVGDFDLTSELTLILSYRFVLLASRSSQIISNFSSL